MNKMQFAKLLHANWIISRGTLEVLLATAHDSDFDEYNYFLTIADDIDQRLEARRQDSQRARQNRMPIHGLIRTGDTE